MLSNMAIIICVVSWLICLAIAAPAPLPQRSLITLSETYTELEPTQTTIGTILGNEIVIPYPTTSAESDAPPETVYESDTSLLAITVIPGGRTITSTAPGTAITTITITTGTTTIPWDPSSTMPLVEGPGPVDATLPTPSENGDLEKRATLTTFHVPTRAPGHGTDYMPPKMKREVVEEPEKGEKEEKEAYWNRIIDWAGVQ